MKGIECLSVNINCVVLATACTMPHSGLLPACIRRSAEHNASLRSLQVFSVHVTEEQHGCFWRRSLPCDRRAPQASRASFEIEQALDVGVLL